MFQNLTKPRDSARRLGFTLIELLVVIAVIAILSAILFPSFARARENARRISCMSNLKQIGLGFLQYTQDYDEAYPLTSYSADPTKPNISWTIGAAPYLKSTQIFRCPSDSTAVWSTPASPPANNYYTTSYLMNAWMAGTGVYAKQSAIQSTSTVALLTESNNKTRDHFHPFFWGTGSGIAGLPEQTGFMAGSQTWDSALNQTTEIPLTRHLEGFNIAYADGHVKWTKWSQVWPPKSGQALQGVFDPRNQTT